MTPFPNGFRVVRRKLLTILTWILLNLKILVVSQIFLLLFPLIAIDLRPITIIAVYYCIILFQQQEQPSKGHLLVEVPTVTCCSSWFGPGRPTITSLFFLSQQPIFDRKNEKYPLSYHFCSQPSPSSHMTSLTVPISLRYVSGAFRYSFTIRSQAVETW